MSKKEYYNYRKFNFFNKYLQKLYTIKKQNAPVMILPKKLCAFYAKLWCSLFLFAFIDFYDSKTLLISFGKLLFSVLILIALFFPFLFCFLLLSSCHEK